MPDNSDIHKYERFIPGHPAITDAGAPPPVMLSSVDVWARSRPRRARIPRGSRRDNTGADGMSDPLGTMVSPGVSRMWCRFGQGFPL